MKLGLLSAISALALFQCQPCQGSKRPMFLYINTSFENWSDPCIDIKYMIDQGATEVILAFWLNTGYADAAIAWDLMSLSQRHECLEYAHSRGAKVLLAAGGATDAPYSITTGEDYGTRAAQATIDLGLDGLDFDLELLPAGFSDQFYYDWLVDCSRAARKVFDGYSSNQPMILTHAPQGPYFTSWAGTGNGYVRMMKELGDVVDYYLVQYYNQQACTYSSYSSIFEASEPDCWSRGAAVLEIKAELGAEDERLWSKIVVGKPATTTDVMNTGFVAPAALGAYICQAERDIEYSGGVMAWSYRGQTHTEMTSFFNALGGARCASGPSTEPVAPTEPAELTGGEGPTPTDPVEPTPTDPVEPTPTDPVEPTPTEPVEPTPTVPFEPTRPTGSKCFHNTPGVWWLQDCNDPNICMLDDGVASEAACMRLNAPYPVWTESDYSCREAVLAAGGCQRLASTATAAPPAPGGDGCYHNEESVWWNADCGAAELCMFDGQYPTKATCESSGYPHANYGSESDCRAQVKNHGGCTD